MNGTSTDESMAPATIGALPPIRMQAPRSLPGRSAFGITLMQCMHFAQSPLSISSVSPSQSMHFDGQRPQTSAAMSSPPAAYSATAAWSTWMSSRQVPMTLRSARAIEATQSFGQPDALDLELVGERRAVDLVLVVLGES